jgi:hypothetical protein
MMRYLMQIAANREKVRTWKSQKFGRTVKSG